MPVYEYVCTSKKCQNVFTELAKFEEAIKCPLCHRPSEKQISTTHHPVFLHRRSKWRSRK